MYENLLPEFYKRVDEYVASATANTCYVLSTHC